MITRSFDSAFERVQSEGAQFPTYFVEMSTLEHDRRYEVRHFHGGVQVTNLLTKKEIIFTQVVNGENEVTEWVYNQFGSVAQDLKIVIVND